MRRSELLGLFGSVGVAACLSSLPYVAWLKGLFSYFGSTEVAIACFLGLSALLGAASAYLSSARAFASVLGGLIGFAAGLWALHRWAGLGDRGHGDMFFLVVAAPGIMFFCAGAGVGSMIFRHLGYHIRR